MPRQTRSATPMVGIKHGLTGYNKGCGCDTCRKAKNAAQDRVREKVRALQPVPAAEPPEAGVQEALTQSEIDLLGTLTPEGESLANLALVNARLIDRITKEEKWHLLSPTVRTLRELIKELKALSPLHGTREAGDEDDFAATLRSFGE